jgi:hypothetical protein
MWWTHRAQRIWETEAWETSVGHDSNSYGGTSRDTSTMVYFNERCLPPSSFFLPQTQDTRGDAVMPTSNPPAALLPSAKFFINMTLVPGTYTCMGMPSGRNYVVYG